MHKINLLVIDTDEGYLESLINYISVNHNSIFNVAGFTSLVALEKFISNSSGNADILMSSAEIITENISKYNFKLVIILNDENSKNESNFVSINKFTVGQELINTVLKHYKQLEYSKNNKNTKISSFYSPSGGAGKTTLAYGCSCLAAQMGKEILYLNLENTSTTSLFFNTDSFYNLSHCFYYINSNIETFKEKFLELKNIDETTNISYLNPPKSSLDFNDVLPTEIKNMLNAIKELNIYDSIFIDLSSGLTPLNIEVFSCSDKIAMITSHEFIHRQKLENTYKDFEILKQNRNIDLNSKVIQVGNRYSTKAIDENINVKIPKVSPLYYLEGEKYRLNLDTIIKNELEKLLIELNKAF